jgi:hypothetical protein
MEFGVPSKQRVKVEKYPELAVLTLHPHAGAKTSRKIEFNAKAYEVLGLKEGENNHVAFSFDTNNPNLNMIINANDFKMDAALKIAKNGILSNKPHYNEIKSRFNVTDADTLELTIVESGKEYKGHQVYRLATVESVEEGEDQTEDFTRKPDSEVKEDAPMAETVTETAPENKSEEPSAAMSIGSPVKDTIGSEETVEANDVSLDDDEDDDLPF